MKTLEKILGSIGFIIGFVVTLTVQLVIAGLHLAFYAIMMNPFITTFIWYGLNIVFQGNEAVANGSLEWWAVAQPVFLVTYGILWVFTLVKAFFD
jgi:hypothetical protein